MSLVELCVQTGRGWNFTIKVPVSVGEALSVGDIAEVIVDGRGRPMTLRPVNRGSLDALDPLDGPRSEPSP